MFENTRVFSLNEAVDMHPAFIVALLHQNGLTLREIASRNGYAPRTLSTALRSSYPKAEQIIASALGCKVGDIWPLRVKQREARKARLKVL
jgi:Ner family transcriptional regulator